MGKRASGGGSTEGAAGEQEDGGLESGEEEVDDADPDEDADEVETEDGQEEGEGGADYAGAGATATAAAGGAGAAGGESVLGSLDLKTVLPQAIKTGVFFVVARWLGNKLTPTVESHVRTARAIYTAYLVFSQALCMYIRCEGQLVWLRVRSLVAVVGAFSECCNRRPRALEWRSAGYQERGRIPRVCVWWLYGRLFCVHVVCLRTRSGLCGK